MDASVVNDSEDTILAFGRSLTEPGTDLGQRLPESAGEPQNEALREIFNAIAERMGKDLRELALIANASSTRIAQNSFFLDQIGKTAASEADLIDRAIVGLGKTVDHMREVVLGAQRSLIVSLETASTSASTATRARQVVCDVIDVCTKVEQLHEMFFAPQTAPETSENLRQATRDALTVAKTVRVSAQRIEEALIEVAIESKVTHDQMAAIEKIASEQTKNLEGLVLDARTVAAAATSTLRAVADAGDLHIGDLNSRLHEVIGRYRLGTFVDRALDLAEAAALEVEAILEEGVQQGRFPLNALLAPEYRELRGAEALALGRLFELDPRTPSFDPAKYGTSYDAAIDEELCQVLDRHADSNPILTAICVLDNNAFHIGYSRAGRAAITGSREIDRASNRIKRIFDDRTSLRCARVGLDGADSPSSVLIPTMLESRENRRTAKTRRPYLLQSYARDTGEVFNDLSVALYVQDRHYGALSIAYHAHVV
jgi:methyl-accepting chemotaxis protein